MNTNVSTLSIETVELMTSSALVALYNELGPRATPNFTPVKKFETKSKAVHRVMEIVKALQKAEVAVAPKPTKAPKPVKGKPAKEAVAKLAKDADAAAIGKPVKAARPNICGRIRELMVEQGLTNEAIWKIVQPEFNLDDKKRCYPAWVRGDLRRKGKL